MNRIKTVIVLIVIGIIFILMYNFSNWLMEDEYAPPTLPTSSAYNKITVTSNGCCLWAEDVVVSTIDSKGEKTTLSITDKVYENDIFDYDIPDSDLSQISLLVELTLVYPEKNEFYKEVFRYNGAQDLKDNGVLVFIEEADGAYINIISGSKDVRYKLIDGESTVWRIQNE